MFDFDFYHTESQSKKAKVIRSSKQKCSKRKTFHYIKEMPVKFTQSMSNSRPSSINISKVMDQNGSKRAREEEELVGRRVRMKLEEAKNIFSRNQQSLLKMVEENEKITDDIIEDLEEKVDELTDALEEKTMELEDKEKLLKLKDKAVADLKESHRKEMKQMKEKLEENLRKGNNAELFNKEVMSNWNPDLAEAVRTSFDQVIKVKKTKWKK